MNIDGCNWIQHDYKSRVISCDRCGTKKQLKDPIMYGRTPDEAKLFIAKHKRCKGVLDF